MDYLTRLIQRASGTAPSVQPLLRSRYAPEDGEALPPDEIADGLLAEALPEAHPDLALVPPREVPADKGSTVADADAPARDDAVEVVMKGYPGRIRTTDGTPGKAGNYEMEMPPVPDQRLTRNGHPDEVPFRMPSDPEPVKVPVRSSSPEQVGPEDGLLMPRGVEEPVFPASAVEPSPERPLTRSGAAESEPPIVRVTIGRIDVRTPPPSAPPAPAPRPGTASPPLSLDEYLRHGGRG